MRLAQEGSRGGGVTDDHRRVEDRGLGLGPAGDVADQFHRADLHVGPGEDAGQLDDPGDL